jgi:hypothetical protein
MRLDIGLRKTLHMKGIYATISKECVDNPPWVSGIGRVLCLSILHPLVEVLAEETD